MNYLGSDFNNTGSVMTKSEIRAARLKRGECVTCGTRCFRKKLFKMVPLDVQGKVLNGRCLNCKPLQPKDVSTTSLNSSTSSTSKFTKNHSGSGRNIHSGRRGIYKKSSSRRVLHHPHHLRKSQSNKEVESGAKQSPPGRTISSSGIQARSVFYTAKNNSSTASNRTSSTAVTTRQSLGSVSALNTRASPISNSSRSIASASSSTLGAIFQRLPLSTCNSTNASQSNSQSNTSHRSVITTGSTSKQTEIAWTPPAPLYYDRDSTMGNNPMGETPQLSTEHKTSLHGPRRSPSRLHSLSSMHSSGSKRFQHQAKLTPTREELEQATFTLIAAQHRGLMTPNKFHDMLDELAASASASDLEKHREPELAKENDYTPHTKKSSCSPPTFDMVQNSRLAPPTNLGNQFDFPSFDASCQENKPQESSFTQRPLLNRGGAFQPRSIRPRVGTHVYTGSSSRTLSSISSIGEEDHIATNSNCPQGVGRNQPQEDSMLQPTKQESVELLNFSGMRSCRTLGSLSSIEVINEEDPSTELQSSISVESLSVEGLSLATPKKGRSRDRDVVKTTSSVPGSGIQHQFSILREFSSSLDQVQLALESLSTFAEPMSNNDVVVNEKHFLGMEIVITVMELYAANRDIQYLGCRAILNLTSFATHSCSLLVETGAANVISKAMDRFLETDQDFQELAIKTLSKLAMYPASVDHMLGKGNDTVSAIIAAMGRYTGDTKIQITGCLALRNIASHCDLSKGLEIMEKGAGEAIIFNAMTMHTSDSKLQSSSLSAVLVLCQNSLENQEKFLDLGVVDPILSAIKKHRHAPAVQEAAAGILDILIENNVETKSVIVENDGIKWLLRAVLDHSKNECCGVAETCTSALLALTLNTSVIGESSFPSNSIDRARRVIDVIIDAMRDFPEENCTQKIPPVIAAVVAAMEDGENFAFVQEIGCVILSSLAELSDDGLAISAIQTKMDIVDEGALDVINMAMVLHGREVGVVEQACSLLLKLVIEENLAAIMAAIGVPMIKEAVDRFPNRCKDIAEKLIPLLEYDEVDGES